MAQLTCKSYREQPQSPLSGKLPLLCLKGIELIVQGLSVSSSRRVQLLGHGLEVISEHEHIARLPGILMAVSV